jgi:hypothetical protein
MHAYQLIDRLALEQARKLSERMNRIQCSGLTGSWTELFSVNRADYTAISGFTSELSLLTQAGVNDQPVLPALFFHQKDRRTFGILARGVLSTTATPSYTFQVRLGTTAGAAFISGTSVGVSAVIVTASGVTNQWWELRLELTCYTPGIGSGACTLSGTGYVMSPGGFASPFIYPLEPTTPPTATWTATIDDSVTQYVNLSVTSTASSGSNALTLKQLMVFGYN